MTKHTLKSVVRKEVGRSVKKLRVDGHTPANVFGNGVKSAIVQVSEKDLVTLLKDAGESTLVYLKVEGEDSDRPVMISELRRNPVTGQILHVAFHQVDLKQKVTASVPVELVGESQAIAEKVGILVQQLSEIEVEALPTDVPEKIEVDISSLAEVNAAIYVKDLKVSGDIKIESDPEAIVVKIEPLAAEEVVEAPAPAEGEAAAEGEAKEGEEKTEGEAAKAEETPAEKE